MWKPHITSIILSLSTSLLNIGIASNSPTQNSRTDLEVSEAQTAIESEIVQIPYTLNQQEVQGAIMLFADGISTPATPSGIVEVSVDDVYFSAVYVYDADDFVVAKDVVAPGIKMELVFNAENSARTEVVEALLLTALPIVELKELYEEIDDQELFPELVTTYRQDAESRDDGKVIRLAIQIAHALEIEVLKPEVGFRINTDEVAPAEYISAGFLDRTEQKLNGITSGTFRLPIEVNAVEPAVFARLTSDNGDILSEDVVIYGVKETLTFDAASSARVAILGTALLFDVKGDRFITAYCTKSDAMRS